MTTSLQSHVSAAAQRLSALGASKGGIARAEKLTPEQRSAIARKGALARAQRFKERQLAVAVTAAAAH